MYGYLHVFNMPAAHGGHSWVAICENTCFAYSVHIGFDIYSSVLVACICSRSLSEYYLYRLYINSTQRHWHLLLRTYYGAVVLNTQKRSRVGSAGKCKNNSIAVACRRRRPEYAQALSHAWQSVTLRGKGMLPTTRATQNLSRQDQFCRNRINQMHSISAHAISVHTSVHSISN